MSIARIVIGTLRGIPQAAQLAELTLDDLYEIAGELNLIHEAIMSQALDVVAREEGRKIYFEHLRKQAPEVPPKGGDRQSPHASPPDDPHSPLGGAA